VCGNDFIVIFGRLSKTIKSWTFFTVLVNVTLRLMLILRTSKRLWRDSVCLFVFVFFFRCLMLNYIEEVTPHGPIPQSSFLTRMGLEVRVEGLKRGALEERRKCIESAAMRLVDPVGMGKEYLVLGINSDDNRGGTWPFVEVK
jgi:hypothetical protein